MTSCLENCRYRNRCCFPNRRYRTIATTDTNEMTTKQQQPTKSVGVIGLGPAGLVAVKELKNNDRFGVVTGFDRCSRVGGRWSLDTDAYPAGIWKELCANTTRSHMEYSDFPWYDDINTGDGNGNSNSNGSGSGSGYNGHERAYAGLFPHCTEVQAYLEAYARNFDLYPHLQLETEVTSIERVAEGEGEGHGDGDGGGGGWKITTASRKSGAVTVCRFDAIVVCNSAQAKPYHPLEEKFREFEGEVIHSNVFGSEQEYNDKRVLVIGSNVSGSEIASILAEGAAADAADADASTKKDEGGGGCKRVVHSVRKMPYHVTKVTPGSNLVFEDLFFLRAALWAQRVVPESIAMRGMKRMILEYWPEQCDKNINDDDDNNNNNKTTSSTMPNNGSCAVGVAPDIQQSGIAVTTNYVDHVKKGNLPVKPDVAGVHGKTITFADGTIEDFDAIICATGYDFDLSFLPESVRETVGIGDPTNGKTILALYKNTLVPTAELVDSLAFCGLVNSVGPYFPQAEMQARYIASVWSKQIPRPPLSELQRNAEFLKNKKLDKSNIVNQYDMSLALNEELGDELGITPSYASTLTNPVKYLFKPIFPSFYRNNPDPDSMAPKTDTDTDMGTTDDNLLAAKSRKRFDQLVASSPRTARISS